MVDIAHEDYEEQAFNMGLATLERINNILKDRTTIIITHRLHTIRSSDLILVMKNGEIIAQGDHTTLLRNSPDYRKIFRKHTIHVNNLKEESS